MADQADQALNALLFSPPELFADRSYIDAFLMSDEVREMNAHADDK